MSTADNNIETETTSETGSSEQRPGRKAAVLTDQTSVKQEKFAALKQSRGGYASHVTKAYRSFTRLVDENASFNEIESALKRLLDAFTK